MPELPEVEIVCRNLSEILQPPTEVQGWKFFRKDLRFVIPQKKLNSLIGKKILSISRRAKYILIEFSDEVVISHLGMTGQWRVEKSGWQKQKHDHVALQYSKDSHLVYSDPRRFGFIEFIKKSELNQKFESLGPEPLQKDLDFNKLTEKFKKLDSTIKVALMDQKLIVGVGNIYASEVLFMAKVNPLKKCSKVKIDEYQKIWRCTQVVLQKAIDQGGSTIENYKNSFGQSGDFQSYLQVYDREGEDCLTCRGKIRKKVLGGRATFWCATCQKN